MLRVAIAEFDKRVSPRFDIAETFAVVTLHKRQICMQHEMWAGRGLPGQRISVLVDRGVSLLICGGIDRLSRQQLTLHGIEILSPVTGKIDDVLNCFLKGKLEAGMMIGAGGRCRGRWMVPAERPAELAYRKGGEFNAKRRSERTKR